MLGSHTSRQPCHLLVVEDDQDLRESLCELLGDEGYVVEAARDGLEALQRLRRSPLPHLVLLDLVLPGISGGELLRTLQTDPRLQGLKIAAFTGDAKAEPTGVVATLRKPFELEELIRLVAEHCP